MAGLTDALRKAVKSAVLAAGDLAINVIYHQVSLAAYDPTTDQRSESGTAYTNVHAMMVRGKEDEMDWTPISQNVAKLIIPYLNLPITPKLDDYVTIGGVQWEIKKIKPLPGTPAHILYIQGP